MDKKLFLLDAMALIYRAYYALIRNPILTSKGKNTNAQFGFTNTLFELITKEKPTHLAVAFDTVAPTERHTDFLDYKANRQEAPEDLTASLSDIKKIIKGFNLPVVECDGYEADDVIGGLAQQAEKEGFEVFMVTPDKDFGQLVTDKIKIYKPGYQGGKVEIMGAKEVCEKWNIQNVSQVIDILGLMGDAIDNIPGIPGVGEKTASKLLAEYGTLDNILANADNIKGALGEKIRAGKESAIMSKKLATIITQVPCEFHDEDFRIKPYNLDALKEIFTELEFKTLGRRILGEEYSAFVVGSTVVQTDLFGNAMEQPIPKPEELAKAEEKPGLVTDRNINNTPHQYYAVEGETAIKELIEKLEKEKEISFDTETTNVDANNAELVGLSFCFKPGEGYYVPCPPDMEETRHLLHYFIELFSDESKIWIGQNLKYDLLVLKWYGIELKGKVFDTMLAHYVIESEGRRSMDLLSAQYLGYLPISIDELIGKKARLTGKVGQGKGQGTMRDVELEKIKEYAAEDADITLQLKNIFAPDLKTKQVEKVFDEVESPLVKVLTDMEYEGVKVDMDFLNLYSKELEIEAKRSEESVYAQAEVRFNLSSPKQLGEVLFEKLKLDPKAKTTKGGQYATGEDVLLKLSHQSKIVEDILNYRELTKLKSTYVDALPQIINKKTGRVHTCYGQAIAVTGRLSSNNPNLQNIPVRTERGREIRKAFIPKNSDYLIISADYSQIELRIVAAISGDPAMCNAFKQGKDIHTATAAKVFNVAEEDVTKEMRYKAKSVNFGIIYGQGAFGLSENLNISRGEAREIIETYKKEFANIQKYMDDSINFCRANGYVQTLIGRRRWLKDINSSNFTVRGYAERNAINSPIQGTAADMIKLAMIKIHDEFKKHSFRSKMIMQVHDELVFDAHKEEVEIIKPIIIDCMQTALQLPNDVPSDAEVGVGENWLEAH
ncbi:MAG: DNA polymerase I [Chitinophagaceae bacterium]|nr:DNA polymerase I [Chitinophagaceae bacterium]